MLFAREGTAATAGNGNATCKAGSAICGGDDNATGRAPIDVDPRVAVAAGVIVAVAPAAVVTVGTGARSGPDIEEGDDGECEREC